jgi:hypothetical protein
MDRYFPVEDGFDFLSALSILTKQGHIVVMNWSAKETYPKKEGKGAAKPFWPVIGLAILSKEMFLQFRHTTYRKVQIRCLVCKAEYWFREGTQRPYQARTCKTRDRRR